MAEADRAKSHQRNEKTAHLIVARSARTVQLSADWELKSPPERVR
jgi:hypothetical protein